MKIQALWIAKPGQAELREEQLPRLEPDQVLVRALATALSPGTERLFYHGHAPPETAIDSTLPGLTGKVRYPLKYGYSSVGRVERIGADVDSSWQDRTVFAFRPHQTHFQAHPAELLPLDPSIAIEDAVFLPNVETAVNFVHDGAPLLGERVVVHGLGVVGQLTLSLLTRFPLAALVGVDPLGDRRRRARARGADRTFDPSEADQLAEWIGAEGAGGADLSYELSGAPPALDLAIATTGFGGRVVIGSWYGDRLVSLRLGEHFHRSRIRLISSQVSTVDPILSGRWSKARRLEEARRLIPELTPSDLITHRLPFSQSPTAYQLLEDPGVGLGIVISYDGSS